MFLLYQKKYKTEPETVEIDGILYHINADFRNILRIFDIISNDSISKYKKIHKLKEWLFENDLPKCEFISFDKITDIFNVFINTNNLTNISADEETGRQFCYNFDAEEIYASFISEYGIDLIDVDFLHWYKFKILLENLSPESAFKRKIELRFMDLDGMNAVGGRKFGELIAAKEAVQLPEKYALDENNSQEANEFNEIWGKVGDN